MKSVRYYAEKAAEALDKAEEEGVEQITGQLGRTDGCRCAEGVIADMLAAEGVLRAPGSHNDKDVYYRNPEIGRNAALSLREVLGGPMLALCHAVAEEGGPLPISEMNDSLGYSFGEIAEQIREGLEIGFYGE